MGAHRAPPRATAGRSIISADKASSWVYAEEFLPEDDAVLAARERAAQLGASAVTPGTGAVLTLLAAASKARAVVEIGTGTGVASLFLLRGMPADGILTTIDSEVEHHRAAKERAMGFTAPRWDDAASAVASSLRSVVSLG